MKLRCLSFWLAHQNFATPAAGYGLKVVQDTVPAQWLALYGVQICAQRALCLRDKVCRFGMGLSFPGLTCFNSLANACAMSAFSYCFFDYRNSGSTQKLWPTMTVVQHYSVLWAGIFATAWLLALPTPSRYLHAMPYSSTSGVMYLYVRRSLFLRDARSSSFIPFSTSTCFRNNLMCRSAVGILRPLLFWQDSKNKNKFPIVWT